MKIFPHTKHEWLSAALFPFKAFVVIAPILFQISVGLHPYRRFPATDFETLLAGLMFLDGVVLLFTALLLAAGGPRGYALPAAGFAVAAFVLGEFLLVGLAR
jgi:hypothetical protein